MKFSIKNFFSKFLLQICRKVRIRSHLLQKSLMENFIFCSVLQMERTHCSKAVLRSHPNYPEKCSYWELFSETFHVFGLVID